MKRFNRKALCLFLTLAMISSLFFGLTFSASAAVGSYEVTFSGDNVTVSVGGTPVTSATSASNGTLTFTAAPATGYKVTKITANAPNSKPRIAKGNSDSYTVSGVEEATTVEITTAAYSGYWTDSENYYDILWYGSGTSYTLTTAAELAGLAYLVKEGTTTFSGVTITLGGDIDLSGHLWHPIGGVSGLTGAGVPDTDKHFDGTFDGANHTISGLYIPYISGSAAYGFFGYVNNGTLLNVKLEGVMDVGTNAVSTMGSLVGYTNGTIYNCHSDVWVYMGNTSPSQAGGIAGVVENLADSYAPIYVQYCSNTGDITGRGRVGGIVGAAYTIYPGNVIVDQCYNKADLTTVGSNQKSYLGGIVGYSRGYITNCYSFSHIETSGGHYQAGIVGLMQGANPQAKLSNCYANSTFGANANPSYDRWLFGSTDFSSTLEVANSLWVNTYRTGGTAPPITQPTGTSSAQWGDWTRVGYFYDAPNQYASTDHSEVYTTTTTDLPKDWSAMTALDVLNSTSSIVSTGVFQADNPTTPSNDGYPILAWQVNGVPAYPGGGTPGGPTDTDDPNAVFLDGTAAVNGTGTKASPFNNFADAAAALPGAVAKAIYVRGEVTIASGANDWDLSGVSGAVVKRSSLYNGNLVKVTGGSLDLTNIVFDGNKTAVPSAAGSIIYVDGGTLTVDGGATLQNNSAAQSGGAILVDSGSATISGGTLTNNYAIDGGAIYVAGGSATLSGGTLGNNSAIRGGAVYVPEGGAFTMTGGAISGNTATQTGGGVCVRGAFETSGGTIGGSDTGNSAANGGGVAVMDEGEFTMTAGSITYNSATTNGGGVYIANTATVDIDPSATIVDNTPDQVYRQP